MKAKLAGYWIATALLSFVFAGGGVADLVLAEPVKEAFTRLGYPLYLGRLLGVLKILGVIAVLAPKLPLLKEWAYAGFFFDLTGAAYLHAAVGDIPGVPVPLAIVGLLVASYLLRRPGEARVETSPVPELVGVGA